MTFGIGLSAGLKALSAARLGIETAGQNVANANTPGYSRQRLLQSATMPFNTANGMQVGTGVQVNDIRRVIDTGLIRRVRTQIGEFGRSEIDFARLRELENVFNEPDGGLSTNLSDFFGQIQGLQSNPADTALRGGMIQGGRGLAVSMNQLANRFDEIESSAFHEVTGHLQRVNQLAGSIAQLNSQIAAIESGSSTANDLRDTREMQIQEIAGLMDVRVLERSNGVADVQVSGFLLVAGSRTAELSAKQNSDGKTEVFVASSKSPVNINSGRIAGLLRNEQTVIPKILAKLDKMAKNLALEFNRIHSTGTPSSGSFKRLISDNPAQDLNGNSIAGDELLSQSGFPFDIQDGELYVTITNEQTGNLQRHRLEVKPESMSLKDLAANLNAIDHLSATVDPVGRMRLAADSGYGFDFGAKLDPMPDNFSSFGSASAVAASNSSGPYDMSGLPAMDITIAGNTHNITFSASQFQNPASATAEELAAAINSTPGFSADGEAAAIGDRIVIRSNTPGSTASIDIVGPAQSTLGLPAGTVTGQDNGGLKIEVQGRYTGEDNGQFVFVADNDGTLGVTEPLSIGVFNSDGQRIATIDAGPNGSVTEEFVEVRDGVSIKITGTGDISASGGDVFALDTLADTDTSDVLVATGLNSFFQGSTAADLAINSELEKNPGLLSIGITGEAGDTANLEKMLDFRDTNIAEMNNQRVEGFYNNMVGDLGFEVAGAETILLAEDQLMVALEEQRQSISGVNLDEEMIDLVAYQQAFEAASRLINVVNDMTNTLINLGA